MESRVKAKLKEKLADEQPAQAPKPAPDIEVDTRPRCPHCTTLDIRRSQIAGFRDYLMRLVFDRAPYRCRSCRHRFYMKALPGDEEI